jgi:divalent metal cation (Fe/Co/Zn/Cd) transporter
MEPLERPWISLAVLAASMVFEGLSFRVAYREYRGVVRGREAPLWRFLRESKDPSLFATLMEDGAALIGLAIAAAGVVASGYLGALWADGVASICIGVLLVLIAAFLANETRSLIAGEAAAGPVTERLRAAAAASDELGELADFKTLQLGPNAILVATGWRFPPDLEGRALAAAVERLRARLCEADPRTTQVLLAPAKTGPAEV